MTQDGQHVAWLHPAFNSEFRTERKVGVGSPRSAVEAAYGRPEAETEVGMGLKRMIYDSIGLSIIMGLFGDNVIVFAVSVFHPGAAKTLWKF